MFKVPPRSPIILFVRADVEYITTGKNKTLEQLEKTGKMRKKKIKKKQV